MCGLVGALDSLALTVLPDNAARGTNSTERAVQDAARERQGGYGDHYSTASNNSSCGGPK